MKEIISVAIDGPAGAGKSTIAKQIAKEKNYIYLDTGAMYRAFTLFALNNKVNYNDLKEINKLLDKINIEFKLDEIYVNSENVTKEIRSPLIDSNVSNYAKIKEVREKMVTIQQKIALGKNVIMDGRDIGTVVLPNASFKIYLDASSEERAKRRFLQEKEKGFSPNYDKILNEIIKRDKIDTLREVSPLRKAEDAIYIDTSNMNEQEVINKIISIINGEN